MSECLSVTIQGPSLRSLARILSEAKIKVYYRPSSGGAPEIDEGQWVKGARYVVFACDEPSKV